MTNKSEDDGALICPPPSPALFVSALFYGYLKLAQNGKKLKEGLVVVTPGNQTRDLLHRKPCTNQLWLSFLQQGYILFLVDAAHVSPSSFHLT